MNWNNEIFEEAFLISFSIRTWAIILLEGGAETERYLEDTALFIVRLAMAPTRSKTSRFSDNEEEEIIHFMKRKGHENLIGPAVPNNK